MRILTAVTVCVLLSTQSFAQRGTPPPPTDRTKASYMSAAEVRAAIAKLPTDRAQSSVRVFTLAPYNVNIEHRQPMAQGASVHPDRSELFYIIEGSATMLTGGKLAGEGKTIEGGVSQKFAPGDWLMVPSGVPHQFIDIKSGPITILSLHLPDVKPDAK